MRASEFVPLLAEVSFLCSPRSPPPVLPAPPPAPSFAHVFSLLVPEAFLKKCCGEGSGRAEQGRSLHDELAVSIHE